jgi:arylsulfatase A
VKANPTIAQYLKKSGYTIAVCGKWHVGPPENDKEIPSALKPETDFSHPRESGFDRQCIFGGAHLEKYWDSKLESYTPEIIQKWAIEFLKEPERKKCPFFLYYASPIPHVPLLPTPLNPNGKSNDNNNFPFLIEYLDIQIGDILRTLDEAGLAENTIVIFSGDNGTNRIVTQMDNGREIKGAKGTLTDAGVNVPLIVSYPGKIAEGSICTNLVDFSDLMPTFLHLAGSSIPKGIDGISFYGQLIGQKSKPRKWVHSHFNGHYFVRSFDYKLRDGNFLYSMKEAPYQETLIEPENDTFESQAARNELQLVINRLYKGYSPPYISGHKTEK